MAQSLVKILIHTVFSTKDRVEIITPEIDPRLFGYISGICENNKSKLIIANGTANHVHLLISLGKTLSISELIGDVKRSSSFWIKEQERHFASFHWQEGYGVFSVSESQADRVMKYIEGQKEHHRTKTFENEMRGLYRKYKIEFDERYIWN